MTGHYFGASVKRGQALAGSFWQIPGADAQLARLWRAGIPVRRIAIEMSEMFGRLTSHNACVARAHRIDLGPHPAGPYGATQPRRKSSKARAAARRKLADVKIKSFEQPSLPATRVGDVARVQLADISRGQCHFPIGDPRKPGFGYCGCETGSRTLDYCSGHYARMYVTVGEHVC